MIGPCICFHCGKTGIFGNTCDTCESLARMTHDDYAALATEPVAACNLCGCTDLVEVADRDRFGYPARATMCAACGLVQLNPHMSAESYEEFYRSGTYRRIVEAARGKPLELPTGQQLYADRLVEFAAAVLDGYRGGTLLDIGGSNGIIAGTFARAFDLTPTVLEPSDAERADAEAAGIETIAGTLDAYEPAGRRWNVISIIQSIDHFIDVAGTLERVRAMLEPGGLLLVDIIEWRTVIKLVGVQGAVKIDHPTNLTHATMLCYLLRAGFEPVVRFVSGGKSAAQMAVTSDQRKAIYLCAKARPIRALPDEAAVDELFGMVGMERCQSSKLAENL